MAPVAGWMHRWTRPTPTFLTRGGVASITLRAPFLNPDGSGVLRGGAAPERTGRSRVSTASPVAARWLLRLSSLVTGWVGVGVPAFGSPPLQKMRSRALLSLTSRCLIEHPRPPAITIDDALEDGDVHVEPRPEPGTCLTAEQNFVALDDQCA